MSQAPAPAAAATILMLRDGDQGLETFMVVRHRQIDFASGALVFPGGRIDAQDGEVRDYCQGVDEADDTSLAFRVGAIREAFEESGILLARPAGQTELISGERLAQIDKYRDPLNKGELGLKQFLESEQLILACDLLQHFAHWITPEMMPKRFDTHFYLAAAPLDHLAVHDGHESVDSVWISPTEALEGAKSGKYTIIFPTRLNVELLGQSHSLSEALQMAQDRTAVTVMPSVEKRDDGVYLCIPADAGYSLIEEKMDGRLG
jgi:8-oxo-dGTP pyrophosphatase MutT (NUDIX family)